MVSDDQRRPAPSDCGGAGEGSLAACYVHSLRIALDYLPRKVDNDCRMELRWIYDRHDVEEARRDLARWIEKSAGNYPKLCAWVEANIEQTLTCLRLPRQHHKHVRSTNMLERLTIAISI